MKKLILAGAISMLCAFPISNAQAAHGHGNNGHDSRNYNYAQPQHQPQPQRHEEQHRNNIHNEHSNRHHVARREAPVHVVNKVIYVYERPNKCNHHGDSLERLLIEAIAHISRN